MRPAPAGPSPVRPLRPSHEGSRRSCRGAGWGALPARPADSSPIAGTAGDRAGCSRRCGAPLARSSDAPPRAEAQAEIAAEVLAVMDDSASHRCSVREVAPRYRCPARSMDSSYRPDRSNKGLGRRSDDSRLQIGSARAGVRRPFRPHTFAKWRLIARCFAGSTPAGVRCLLLWTEEPQPMPLEDALLDRWMP